MRGSLYHLQLVQDTVGEGLREQVEKELRAEFTSDLDKLRNELIQVRMKSIVSYSADSF